LSKYVVDFGKTPWLDPKHKATAQKVEPGQLADYTGLSPELKRARFRVKPLTEGLVFDPTEKSPELLHTRESILAGQAAQDIEYLVNKQAEGIPPKLEAALAPGSELAPLEDVPIEEEQNG
jgi:hypothetical protein